MLVLYEIGELYDFVRMARTESDPVGRIARINEIVDFVDFARISSPRFVRASPVVQRNIRQC